LEEEYKKNQGSLTVEATLVLPVFIYAIMAFIYFLQIIYIQEEIQAGITEVAKYASEYAYIYENVRSKGIGEVEDENYLFNAIDSLTNTTFFKTKLKEYVSVEKLDNSCIYGGFNGITMAGSSFMKKDKIIDIVVNYTINIPSIFFHIKNRKIVQRVRTRGLVGSSRIGKNSEDDDRIVYITKTGTIYHLTKECTHLKLSITPVRSDRVKNLRNQGGGKYKECPLCKNKSIKGALGIVYITNYGDCYHTSLNCSGLKRSIICIPLSKVKNRRQCERCGQKGEE
jgi:hypothetical protein